MIEPNRLRNLGERDALERVDAVLRRIDALGPAILAAQVPHLDPEAREIALNELEQVAAHHGRTELLDDARDRVRDAVLVRSGSQRPGFLYGSIPFSSGSVDDQVARTLAVEDAVAVAVAEDLLDPRVAVALSTPGRLVLGMDPLDASGGVPDTMRADGRSPDSTDRPGEADEAGPDAAEDADAALERAEAEAALRQRRAVVFVIVGAIALSAAYTAGFSVPVLVVIVLAAALLAWVFA